MAWAASSRLGLGFSSSIATIVTMKPGAQNAHWNPPSSIIARWTGCNSPLSEASPSIVVTARPRTMCVSREQA